MIFFCGVILSASPLCIYHWIRSQIQLRSFVREKRVGMSSRAAVILIVLFLFHEDEFASSSSQISKIKTKPLKFPNIFIIGAQKCGTTSTAFLLLQHGDICNKGIIRQ